MSNKVEGGKEFDVIVIGGGIHGVGIAQAAAAAGYFVLVIEKQGLASGTSCKSSKLIHGGLRYLESFEFSLVRDSLNERELLLDLAPELVHRKKFFIPIYRQTSRRAWWVGIGLLAYTVLAGFGKYTQFRRVPRQEWGGLDGLNTENLQVVYQYWDAQTDDAALTRAVMQSATELGAELICPAQFLSAEVGAGSVQVCYEQHRTDMTISTKVLVNAAGPWAAKVAATVVPKMKPLAVDNVAGSHIKLPGQVVKGCYYLEVESDKRAVFVMPKGDRTLVGTTERTYRDDPDKIDATDEAIEYLLDVFRKNFPARDTQILDSWAGLRVLPASQGNAFNRSRETQLPTDNEHMPRVLSVFGGKLTGYRATAGKVMSILRRTLPEREAIADTRKLKLSPECPSY
jgi:glycerol-3-phosphate dehydrogenase